MKKLLFCTVMSFSILITAQNVCAKENKTPAEPVVQQNVTPAEMAAYEGREERKKDLEEYYKTSGEEAPKNKDTIINGVKLIDKGQ